MSILDRLVDLTDGHTDEHDDDGRPDRAVLAKDDGHVTRRRGEPIRAERRLQPVSEPSPVRVRGMRIEGIRLGSVAKIATVFLVLGYLTVLGTLVVLWNAALAFGFVDRLEKTITTSLGLDEPFTLVGQDLFRVAAVGLGVLTVLGLGLTLLLALVYNVACTLFGGLAIETGPLRRRYRVFSWRDRGFVTLRR